VVEDLNESEFMGGAPKDGVEDGPSELYYDNGELSRKGTYKDGDWDGPFECYDENGQLRFKGTFKDGKECGERLEYGETVTYDPCPPGN
jgi:antitoxin component YwqK of YwqJK toxin-antitoxin module